MDFLVHLHQKLHYDGTPNLGKDFFFANITFCFSCTVKSILNLQYLSNDFFSSSGIVRYNKILQLFSKKYAVSKTRLHVST